MPRNPTGKIRLKRNKKTTAAIAACVLFGYAVVAAKIAMQMPKPTAPKSMSLRRPKRSMVKRAMHAPIGCMTSIAAARMRDLVALRARSCWKIVVA